MKKEFIPYEQAFALKELGFKGSSFAYYIENRGIAGTGSDIELVYEHIHDTESFGNLICRVPTYSQAFRWFREKYNLFCEIQIDRTTAPKFCFNIFQYEHFGNYEDIRIGEWYLYRTYEEAELECLKELIEIAKEQKQKKTSV